MYLHSSDPAVILMERHVVVSNAAMEMFTRFDGTGYIHDRNFALKIARDGIEDGSIDSTGLLKSLQG